jgi:predicted short-subunit dehydrogenase-like oxidoreductase (DUF2520 family)
MILVLAAAVRSSSNVTVNKISNMGTPTISIIGTGNVAFQLGIAFRKSGVEICNIWGRDAVKANELSKAFGCASAASIQSLSGDIVIICVSDDAIKEVISQINTSKFVAYTSGSFELSDCGRTENTGVFYPLQTFTKEQEVKFDDIPLLIESQSSDLEELLLKLAKRISSTVLSVNSQQRKLYHLSAVWINNFTNHMVFQAKSLAEENNIDWKVLQPLLEKTALKLTNTDPYNSQTGPARRGDNSIISSHEALLSGIRKEMYTLISKSIDQTYNK